MFFKITPAAADTGDLLTLVSCRPSMPSKAFTPAYVISVGHGRADRLHACSTRSISTRKPSAISAWDTPQPSPGSW